MLLKKTFQKNCHNYDFFFAMVKKLFIFTTKFKKVQTDCFYDFFEFIL